VGLLSALIQLVSDSTTHDPWRSTPVTRGRDVAADNCDAELLAEAVLAADSATAWWC
jgi:hypothetical protein